MPRAAGFLFALIALFPCSIAQGEQGIPEEVILPSQTCGNYFVVDVMVNGVGPYPMILDSGAETTLITPRVGREAILRKRIESIVIGPFRATGRITGRVARLEHIGWALGTDIEGIVGYGVFSGGLLTYDYPRQEIRFRRGTFTEEELEHPGVVKTTKRSRPTVRARVGRRRMTVLIDTGAARSATLKGLDRLPTVDPPRATGGRMRINGLHLVESGRLSLDMHLGPLILSRPLIHDAVNVNLVGQEVLRHFAVTFDARRSLVRFDRPGGPVTEAVTFPSLYGSGLVLEPKADRLLVRAVLEDTPAEESGLLPDDEILAIDGVLVPERGCTQRDGRDDKPEETRFLVRRGEEQFEVSIITAVLVP